MASSIGAYSFISVKGAPNPLGGTSEIVTRSGVNGVALRKKGKTVGPWVATTEADAASEAACKTAITSYKSIINTLVTVVSDGGTSWANQAVLDVEHVRTKRNETAVGGLGAGNWLVTARWTLQATDIP